jgi:hypothetical protein
MIPAEIWRRNLYNVTKLIVRRKKIEKIELDIAHQTADANYDNNSFPPVLRSSRLELFKSNSRRSSLMADMLVELKTDDDKDEADSSDKMVPMEDGNTADSSENMSDKMTNKKKKSSDKMKKSLSDKDQKSLSKTLKRLLGKDKK